MKSRSWLAVVAAISASSALAIPAAGHAAPRLPINAVCTRSFTVHMFTRAAVRAYAGERVPTALDLKHLRRFRNCARLPGDQSVDARVWHEELSDNYQRRHPRPESALAECIIYRESRGDRDAVNGSHEGIGQWDENAWYAGDGERFAPTPLGATYAEQVIVLNDMLPAQAWRWERWDGC